MTTQKFFMPFKFLKRFVLFTMFLSLMTLSRSQDSIYLWNQGAPGALGDKPEDKPCLFIYRAPAEFVNGAAVIICPGGGYVGLAMDHEGKQIAQWFNRHGVTAFVLRYRLSRWDLKKYLHPIQMMDGLRAVRLLRYNAETFGIDPHRIGIMGFSAGGHLASTVGTHFDAGDPKAPDPVDRTNARPDFMILGYPVVSFTTEYTHRGSREHLIGKDLNPELARYLSNELQVTTLTPPTFMFHTDEDDGVPLENSVLFYLALRKAHVPAELHIYQKGRHGVGFAPNDPVLSTWADRLADWLKINGWIK